jgi:hypothetical protein
MVASVDVPAGFDLALTPDRAFDPDNGADRVQEVIGRMEELGTTVVNARIVSQSLDHYVEQLEALAGLAGFPPRTGGAR